MASCFSGHYVTDDVTDEYLRNLEAARSDEAKSERDVRLNDIDGELDFIEEAEEGLVVGGSQGYLAALDRELDDELREEGIARELVSRVQRFRRDSGLDVSDRIELRIDAAEEIEAAAERHKEYIASETLALDLQIGTGPEERFGNVREVEIEGSPVRIGLLRVEQGPPAGRAGE